MHNWDRYENALEESPILMKALTSGSIFAIGDILSQVLNSKKIGSLDKMRTLRSSLAGFLIHGPLSHYWYIFEDQVFTSTEWWNIFPKVVADQMAWTPFQNGSYIAFVGFLQ